MKTVCKRLGSGLLALMLLSATMLSTCSAVVYASDYFARTEVWCSAKGNGKITINYDIDATRTMDLLGVYSVTIYEQQSSGSYKNVKVYDWDNVDGLTVANAYTTDGTLWYQGKAGVKYYATVRCYAKKGTESAILPQTTDIITAT